MQKNKRFLRPGKWFILLCLLMLLTAAPDACAATANFDVQTAAGYHGGYMTVSITITVEPASRIALAATLTDDDGSKLREGTVFSQDEGDTSLTFDFSLPVDNRMTGTEDHIHISCIADANGQTYTYNNSIDWAIAHDNSVSIIESTCSSTGHTYLRCTKCGYERDFILPIDPARHDWGDWVSNHDGTHTRTCKLDSSHTETGNCQITSRINEPTCTEEGYTDHTCTLCGYGYQDMIVPALGHDWGAWTNNGNSTHSRICRHDPSHRETLDCVYTAVVIPPTCETPGLTTHICNKCWHTYDDTPTPAMGHDWGDWGSNNNGTHTRTCKRDSSHQETEKCHIVSQTVEPTCTEEGYTDYSCSVCGYGYIDMFLPAIGHQPGAWRRVLEPTRYAPGKEEQRCMVCDMLLKERVVPKLNGMRYGNTACIDGPHFRDNIPKGTDKWYSYAVIDLEKEGVTEYPLIASNQYRIGTVFVTVSKTKLTVRYELNISKYELREEFLTFFSSLENSITLDTEKLKANAFVFNQPVALSKVPQENGKTILFMRLLLNYDAFDKGVSPRKPIK